MKEYYDGIAPGYDELYGNEQLNKWEIGKKLITFSKKDKVLDLGCGTGILTVKIAEKAGFVTGIDYSKGMIEHAKKKDNVNYVVGDAKHLPFPDNSFDKIVSFTMIQDIENWEAVFKEIKRVAKGDILLTVLKRNKDLNYVKNELSKFFKVNKVIEEEKDFIFLLS